MIVVLVLLIWFVVFVVVLIALPALPAIVIGIVLGIAAMVIFAKGTQLS